MNKIEILKNTSLNSEAGFPLDQLPATLRELSLAYSQSYGTPPELWAASFLSGISAAAGKHLILKVGNYLNYPQLWIMTVGASGTGKSDALHVAFSPLHKEDAKRYNENLMLLSEWEATPKKERVMMPRPEAEQLLIDDLTPEALVKALKNARFGATLYSDELSSWFGDFGRYNQSGEVGRYLSIFNNKPIRVNRKHEDPILIEDPMLNICGTIQPGVLKEVLMQNNAEASGFAQRFLYLYPEFPPRKFNREPVDERHFRVYDDLIFSLLQLPGTEQCTLSNEATNLYESYFNECENIRAAGLSEYWAAVYAKSQIQVLRLAITLRAVSFVADYSHQVTAVEMAAAIAMARFFISSLKQFREDAGAEPIPTKEEVIRQIFRINPEASHRQAGEAVGVSRQYVSKLMKKDETTEGGDDEVPS